MANKKIDISLSNSGSSLVRSPEVTLIQEEITEPLSVTDVYQMYIRARSGLSARTFRPTDCGVRFNDTQAIFTVSFNAFPNDLDLDYRVETSFGTISENVETVQSPREIGVVFDTSDSVFLDRIYSNMSFSPRTPAYNSIGESVPIPEVTVNNEELSIPEPLFVVFRASGTERGFTHFVDFVIDLVDEDDNNLTVESIDATITASWQDGDETRTTQLTLDIPECILNALNLCEGKPNLLCQQCDDFKTLVYFNTCDGEIITTRRVNLFDSDNDTWCIPV